MAEGDTKLYVDDNKAALARAFLKELAGDETIGGVRHDSLTGTAGSDGKYSTAELDELATNLINSLNAAIPDLMVENADKKLEVKTAFGLKTEGETKLRELITKSGAQTPEDLMKVLKAERFEVADPTPADPTNKEQIGLTAFLLSVRDDGAQPFSVAYTADERRALEGLMKQFGMGGLSGMFGGVARDPNINQDTTASLEKAFEVLQGGNVGDLAQLWGEELPMLKDAKGNPTEYDASKVNLWRGPNGYDPAMRGFFNGQDVAFNGTLNPEMDYNFSTPYEAWPGSNITTGGQPQTFDNLITQGLVNSGAVSFDTPEARIAFNNFATAQIFGTETELAVTSKKEFAERIAAEFEGGKNGVRVNTYYEDPTGPSGAVPNTAGYVPPASGAATPAASTVVPVVVGMAAASPFAGRGAVGGGVPSAYVSPIQEAPGGVNFGETIEVAKIAELPFRDLDSALSGDPGTTEIMRHREMVVSEDGISHFEGSEMISAYDLGSMNMQQITPVLGDDGSIDAFFVSQKPWENGAYQEGMGDGYFIDADVFDREALKQEQPALYAQLKLASEEPVIAQAPVVGAPAATIGASPS